MSFNLSCFTHTTHNDSKTVSFNRECVRANCGNIDDAKPISSTLRDVDNGSFDGRSANVTAFSVDKSGIRNTIGIY